MNRNLQTKKIIMAALFAALTAVCSMVSIPLPFSPVPINLATFSVLLSGSLLGPRYGPMSQLVYVLLGAIGLPVFHNFTGGLSILAGPTGGYILGYIAAAFLAGLFTKRLAAGLVTATAACYALGTLWFMYVSGANLISALFMCVIPFLPGDGIKIVLVLLLVKRVKPILRTAS